MAAGAVIGVDLGGTNLRVGKVAGNEVKGLIKKPVSSGAADDVVVAEIIESIAGLFDRETLGIGIGVPSIVDTVQGIVYSVENIPSWKEVHLKQILENRFAVPVYVNNDANCFALGELYYGQGKGFQHLVGLTVGTGLGAGIITGGRLYTGRNCGAGEIGCIPYKEKTIEYYCSGQFFLREAGMRGDELFVRAGRGQQQALEIFRRFGEEMGNAVMTVLYAYDPEIIVFGGSIAAAYRFFSGGMEKRLQEFAYPTALQRLQIAVSNNPQVPVLGAAALFHDAQRQTSCRGDR